MAFQPSVPRGGSEKASPANAARGRSANAVAIHSACLAYFASRSWQENRGVAVRVRKEASWRDAGGDSCL
jgi:hypothetical protein